MNSGFLYIATGEQYIKQAVMSAKNTKRVSDRPIAIVSDRSITSEHFDQVIIDKNPRYSYVDKIRNLLETPFNRTVFLDTDVYLLREVPELFEVLDNVDVATTIDPNQLGGKTRPDMHYSTIPESVPIYQTGVISFANNENVQELMDSWHDIHSKNTDTMRTDQSSFRLAVHDSDIDNLVCSNLYNCLINSPMQVTGTVKIIHGNTINLNNVGRISSIVNKANTKRLFYTPWEGKIHSPTSRISNIVMPYVDTALKIANLINRGLRSMRRVGIRRTARKVYKKYS